MLITRRLERELAEITARASQRKSFLLLLASAMDCGCLRDTQMPRTKNIFKLSAGLALAGVFICSSCGDKKKDGEFPPDEFSGNPWNTPKNNGINHLPGSVYASQASSPIHWQPWTPATLEMADDSRRLILAVVALPQQPGFADILKDLSSNPGTVSLINDTYVPVLIDGDAVREMGILTADLCAEIGSGLQLPLLIWMTPEANPVAWMPLPSTSAGSASELLSQSHEMVARTWADDPDYVTQNSKLDQVNRSNRLMERIKNLETSDDPSADALRALRQLTTLYDPLSRTFDEAGGLFPSGALDLLAMGAGMENLPDDLRRRCRSVLESLLKDLLTSPMFDPLDGGVFNARRGVSWSYPGFYRDCSSQSRAVVSLLNAYEATGESRALEKALGVLAFIESNYRTSEGLYTLGSGVSGDARKWLWWIEEVKELLTAEELAVWLPASGMKNAGNLPSEVDPLREHFRGNSIAFAKSAEEIALERGQDPAEVEQLLDTAREKLLAARDQRLGKPSGGNEANAVATFRMISAYATAYRVTGETSYRDLAKDILDKARAHFSDGPRLRNYVGDFADSLTGGRAFLYGVAIQAALDVEAITLNGVSLLWAGDLSSTLSEVFAVDSHIRESPASADLIGLPVTDMAMLFDESTAGLLAMSESRLAALDIPLAPTLKAELDALPVAALFRPVLHTDLIQATLMREFGVTYVFGKNTPEAMRQAIERSPFKGVNRREAKPTDPPARSPKPGEVLRITSGGAVNKVESVGDLHLPYLP